MNSQLQVKYLEDSCNIEWDNFVDSHPEATFFHLSGWRRVIEQAFGHTCWFCYVERNGEILGVLPLAYINSWLFGRKLTSLPFAVYGGVLSKNRQASKLLIEEAKSLAKRLGVDSLELRNQQPCYPDWLRQHHHDTFIKPIADTPALILGDIKKKQRAVLRQALNSSLIWKLEKNTDNFFTVYSESVRNLGTPVFHKRYFQLLIDTFPDKTNILSVFHQGKVVSSVLSFFYKDHVLPYYGGGSYQAKSLKSNDLMYYQLMCLSREMGISQFDFGRSKIGSGAHAYKRHWGFEPTPLYYENFPVKLQQMRNNSPTNPKYQMFIRLWRRLPLSLSQCIGPILAKDLG